MKSVAVLVAVCLIHVSGVGAMDNPFDDPVLSYVDPKINYLTPQKSVSSALLVSHYLDYSEAEMARLTLMPMHLRRIIAAAEEAFWVEFCLEAMTAMAVDCWTACRS